MPVTTGNFQDLVQLSQDTLYHLGPALSLGNSAASTVSFGMSNSSAGMEVAASALNNQTIWWPNVTGGANTILVNVNLSAGTTSNNMSAWTYSNSNNVSFGLNGSVITASAAAQLNLSAGTTSNNLTAVTFSNSNGVSFGLNGSVVTASVATSLSNINVSAGTTSNNLSAVTFSNSNNVSFGLNGSVVTASASAASSQGSINFSGGTTSNNLSAITFSNSNGVSFGLNGSTMTASVATSLTAVNFSAGTTSNNLSAIVFSNSNNVSFGLNGSTLTASSPTIISAGTTSGNLTAFTLSNSNGVSFGLNAGVITAAFGGQASLSSWQNDKAVTAQTMGQGTLFLQPIVIPYNLTATNILWLASQTNVATNSSGGLSVSAALYTLNGGAAGSLSLASSASTNLTWTSGAALSSNTGINYQQMSCSFAITPGPYVFAWWVSTQNSASVSIYGPPQQPAISSGKVAAMSNLVLNGYSQATVAALPSSIGVTNTASYIRTGATAAQQPWFILQGT